MGKDKFYTITLPELGKQKIIFDILLLDQQEAVSGKPIHDIWNEAQEGANSTPGLIKYVSTIILAGIRADRLREGKDINDLPNQYQFFSLFGEWVKTHKIAKVGDILEVYSSNIGSIIGADEIEDTEEDKKK